MIEHSEHRDLPQLKSVFEHLRRGRHICVEDGDAYLALRDRFDEFRVLFDQLGFSLHAHERGFYYFRGDALTETARKIAVFVFILIEHLSDRGRVAQDAMLSTEFAIRDLPHLKTARFSAYMAAVCVEDDDALRQLVVSMQRYGFVRFEDSDRFRFRAPAHRFFDYCYELAEQS